MEAPSQSWSPLGSKLRTATGAKEEKLTLERVIGTGVPNNSAVAYNPVTGDIAYPAGCLVVIYNPRKSQQVGFFRSPGRVAFSCVSYSADGQFLAAGETGKDAAVLVWDLASGALLNTLVGHRHGVASVRWSPSGEYIVSLGTKEDAFLFVWNWRQDVPLATTELKSRAYGVTFGYDNTFVVTCGHGFVKFWTWTKRDPKKKPGGKEKMQLVVKSAQLGTLKELTFVDVACGPPQGDAGLAFTYAVTSKGVLCQIGPRRSARKTVDLKTTGSFALDVSPLCIACGCAEGVIRLFDPKTLEFLATLPRPHPLGQGINTPVHTSYPAAPRQDWSYPGVACVRVSSSSKRIVTMYSDHSLFVWNTEDLKNVGKYRSLLAHSGPVVDLAVCTYRAPFPPGTFATASADNTIRFWSLDSANLPKATRLRNMWSKEMLYSLYVEDGQLADSDGSRGLSSMRLSPDEQSVASGDCAGNIRVHSLTSMEQVVYLEAHDGEVTSLGFSNSTTQPREHVLLATASADTLVHVFDADDQYALVSTFDEQTGPITAVQFASSGSKLLTASADRTVLFRSVEHTSEGPKLEVYHTEHPTGAVDSMDEDPTGRYVVAASEDRSVKTYTVATGKTVRSYKTDTPALRVALDPAGLFAATTHTDKTVRLFDFFSGECVADGSGHAEKITGVRFTPDCRRVISTGADGVILVWRVHDSLGQAMRERLAELHPEEAAKLLAFNGVPPPLRERSTSSSPAPLAALSVPPRVADSPMSPADAKKHEGLILMYNDVAPGTAGPALSGLPIANSPQWRGSTNGERRNAPVQGKWAERAEAEGTVRLYADGDGERPALRLADAQFRQDLTVEDAERFPLTPELSNANVSEVMSPSDAHRAHPLLASLDRHETMRASRAIANDQDDVVITSLEDDDVVVSVLEESQIPKVPPPRGGSVSPLPAKILFPPTGPEVEVDVPAGGEEDAADTLYADPADRDPSPAAAFQVSDSNAGDVTPRGDAAPPFEPPPTGVVVRESLEAEVEADIEIEDLEKPVDANANPPLRASETPDYLEPPLSPDTFPDLLQKKAPEQKLTAREERRAPMRLSISTKFARRGVHSMSARSGSAGSSSPAPPDATTVAGREALEKEKEDTKRRERKAAISEEVEKMRQRLANLGYDNGLNASRKPKSTEGNEIGDGTQTTISPLGLSGRRSASPAGSPVPRPRPPREEPEESADVDEMPVRAPAAGPRHDEDKEALLESYRASLDALGAAFRASLELYERVAERAPAGSPDGPPAALTPRHFPAVPGSAPFPTPIPASSLLRSSFSNVIRALHAPLSDASIAIPADLDVPPAAQSPVVGRGVATTNDSANVGETCGVCGSYRSSVAGESLGAVSARSTISVNDDVMQTVLDRYSEKLLALMKDKLSASMQSVASTT